MISAFVKAPWMAFSLMLRQMADSISEIFLLAFGFSAVCISLKAGSSETASILLFSACVVSFRNIGCLGEVGCLGCAIA